MAKRKKSTKKVLPKKHMIAAKCRVENELVARSYLPSTNLMIFPLEGRLTYMVDEVVFVVQDSHIRSCLLDLHICGHAKLARWKKSHIELDLTSAGMAYFASKLPDRPPPESSLVEVAVPVEPVVRSFVVPTANDLLRPTLSVYRDRKLKYADAMAETAKMVGFSAGKLDEAIPVGSNNTFRRNFTAAYGHLMKHELLTRSEKGAMATKEGMLFLASPNSTFPHLKEPKTKIKVAIQVAKKPNFKKVDGPVGIPDMDMDKLAHLWKSAVKALTDPHKKIFHERSRKMLDDISVEWERRANLPNAHEYFMWPKSDASGGDGGLRFSALETGMLTFLDYRVGLTRGQKPVVRRMILTRVFEGSLPLVFNNVYMAEWGANQSVTRLRKMAECLAAFARNAKRRKDAKLAAAVKDWEDDLKFLYNYYYVGKFNFGWPE